MNEVRFRGLGMSSCWVVGIELTLNYCSVKAQSLEFLLWIFLWISFKNMFDGEIFIHLKALSYKKNNKFREKF